jgi:hypothetical protein
MPLTSTPRLHPPDATQEWRRWRQREAKREYSQVWAAESADLGAHGGHGAGATAQEERALNWEGIYMQSELLVLASCLVRGYQCNLSFGLNIYLGRA